MWLSIIGLLSCRKVSLINFYPLKSFYFPVFCYSNRAWTKTMCECVCVCVCVCVWCLRGDNAIVPVT
jgi:hypothetical protein